MVRRLLVSAVASGVLLGAAGCRHKCCRSDDGPIRPFLPNPPSNIPPAGVPVTPYGGGTVPPVGPDAGGTFPPPADLGSLPPSAPPVPRSSGRPAPEILLPDPVPGTTRRQSVPPPAATILGGPVNPPTVTEVPPAATMSTAGLPGFTKVKDGAASGRKPTLDGFDALKRAGYRTLVYAHAPGADVAALRDVAEKRGLAVVAVETTPEKLPAAADAFNRALADKAAGPVYVADDSGLRAGVLWYLHFRTADAESDEVAKIRARSLGLTDDGDEGKAFWVAIQQYLATR